MNDNQKIEQNLGDEYFLETFGFATNQARKNLVIFFLILMVFSNIFFIYRNIQLENTISQLNKEKLELSLVLSNKITEEVRKQIQPTTIKIEKVVERIDSVATKTVNILSEKN